MDDIWFDSKWKSDESTGPDSILWVITTSGTIQ